MQLRSKLLIVSTSPSNPMLDNLGVYAASQQTLYIVSGSPSNSMLGGGDPTDVMFLSVDRPVGLSCFRATTLSSLKKYLVPLRLFQEHLHH